MTRHLISLATNPRHFKAALMVGMLSFWWVPLRAGFAWESVVWIQDGDVVTANLAGGSKRVVLSGESGRYHFPRLSPDGKKLAVLHFDAGNTNPQVCVYDSSDLTCAAVPGWTYGMSWYSDSETIYYTRNEGDGQIWMIDFGSLTPTAQLFLDPNVYRTFSLSVSGDGAEMVVVHDPSNWTCRNFLTIYDFATGVETTILPGNGLSDFFPDFSPTRGEIVWAQNVSGCGSNFNVWIINSDGSNAANLTQGFSNVSQQNPVFALDGESIFFQHNGELWKMSRDGTGKELLFRMNSGSASVYFDIGSPLVTDISPPLVQPVIAGDLGFDGWYVSEDVEVSWQVSDPESEILSKEGCEAVPVLEDTTGTTFQCRATSEGGTTVSSVTVKRDATEPIIDLRTPAPSDVFILAEEVFADWVVSDATSGICLVATPAVTVAKTVAEGEVVNTTTAGVFDYWIVATDKAGNETSVTHSFEVLVPDQALFALTLTIESLGLSAGIEEALTSRIATVAATLDRGHEVVAIRQLEAIQEQLRAALDAESASPLLAEVDKIIDAIESRFDIDPSFPVIVTVDGLDLLKILWDVVAPTTDFSRPFNGYLENGIEGTGVVPRQNVINFPWSGDSQITDVWVDHLRQNLRFFREAARQNGQPFIVIGHSWGSVLSYVALALESQGSDPLAPDLYITLGSPIGTRSMEPTFPPEPKAPFLEDFLDFGLRMGAWHEINLFVDSWFSRFDLCPACQPLASRVVNFWARGDLLSGVLPEELFDPSVTLLLDVDLSNSDDRGIKSTATWHWWDSIGAEPFSFLGLIETDTRVNRQELARFIASLIDGLPNQ